MSAQLSSVAAANRDAPPRDTDAAAHSATAAAAGTAATATPPASHTASLVDTSLADELRAVKQRIEQVEKKAEKAEAKRDEYADGTHLWLRHDHELGQLRDELKQLRDKEARKETALLPIAAAAFAPTLVSIQAWNIETDRAEDIHNVLLIKHTWAELEGLVRKAFHSRWTAENKGRFALYYINDLLQPLETRADVSNQQELDGYLAFLAKPPRDRGLMLFLNVAVIFQASGKPVSPVKPPLSINTALARTHGRAVAVAASSSSHLSPDSAGSPQSPGTPREKEFRQVVLARDSDGCVRPDTARLGPPACIYRCVFCHKLFLPGKKQIEAAHLIPHAVNERLGKELDVPTLIAIGGSVDSITNGVSACSICHGRFDDGLVWVELPDASATPTIAVHPSIRDVDQHVGPLHNTPLCTPPDASFPFPGVVAWRWRKEWAGLRRQQADESVAKQLAELELQGSPQVPCRCGRANINKKCRTGAGGAPTCKPCCRETNKPCIAHGLAGTVGASTAVSAAAGQ